MVSPGQMRHLYPWEQEAPNALSESLHVTAEGTLVPQMRSVSRGVPHIPGAVNDLLHPPYTYLLLFHGHMFTVHVNAVIDNDWDPGITKVTCLQR